MGRSDSSEAALEQGRAVPLSDIKENSPEEDFLGITQRAYKSGVDYQTANLKGQWEKNICNFRSIHPSGSKYRTEDYKHRSRLFKPKTRATLRQKEAALVLAFFSTSDAVSITADDQDDKNNVAAADALKFLVAHRMSKGLMWFQNAVAAFQESLVMGTVISYQGWERIEEKYTEENIESQFDPETGTVVDAPVKVKKTRVVKDEPFIQLIPSENFLIDPGAHWIDPIGTSPFTIELLPMYIVDVLDYMEHVDTKTGQPKWKKYSLGEISQAISGRTEGSSTRQAREGARQDPKSNNTSDISEYTIVWVFRVIAKIPGKGNLLWYTLGEHLMLSEPIPLQEAYSHLKYNEKPYVAGVSIIEAHRNNPSSLIQLGEDIQSAINTNQNQRFDNVRQVLNKRVFVKRNAQVDLRSLRRNIPGSLTLMSDPKRDVSIHEPGDVTSSSYNEQNLFNSDFDDVMGSFSAGSVANNRQMNETVGGMRMLKDPSNTLTEYIIRVFAETWATPVLDQIARLEQVFETDEKLLQKAMKAAAKEGEEIDLKDTSLTVTVNVGYGVTDPEGRVRRVLYGVDSIGKIAPSAGSRVKDEEITKEIMGILGYQDGTRFYRTDEEQEAFKKQNPPPPNETQMKIESQEKIKEAEIMSQERIELAKMDDNDRVWEARLMSDERKKAAELSVTEGDTIAKQDLELGKRDIEIEKLQNDKIGLAIKREDMLRKDAEIKDKEAIEKNRSGGVSVESKS